MYYTVVKNYEIEFCKDMEEVENFINKKLDNYKELKPTLINESKSTYTTYYKRDVEITTRIYLYKTQYTEVFTIYAGDKFDPLGTIKSDVETQNLRKRWQPQIEEKVKELKEWLDTIQWGVYSIDKENLKIIFKGFNENAGNEMSISGIDREINLNVDIAKKDIAFAIYDKFCDIEGFFTDILAAF